MLVALVPTDTTRTSLVQELGDPIKPCLAPRADKVGYVFLRLERSWLHRFALIESLSPQGWEGLDGERLFYSLLLAIDDLSRFST